MSASVDKDIKARNAGWTFEGISDGFDDHVSKSVQFYEQGHVDRRIVKKNTVGQFAVLAQRFAVIGGDSDQRIVIQSLTP